MKGAKPPASTSGGGLQSGRDVLEAATPRVSQRRDALAVGDAPVGASAQQEFYDLHIGRPTITQDYRLEKRGPAEFVDMIDIDPDSQKEADDLGMAMMRGRDQGRAAVAVGIVELRAMPQDELQDLVATLGPGVEERRILHAVLGVNVCACLDQQAGDLQIVGARRQKQRGPAARVASLGRRRSRQQFTDTRSVSLGNGLYKLGAHRILPFFLRRGGGDAKIQHAQRNQKCRSQRGRSEGT